MKIKVPQTISNVSSWEDLKRFTSQIIDQIVGTLNGRISFTDNCQTAILSVTFTSANQDLVVAHPLGVIPQGFILVGSTVSLNLYSGTLPSTPEQITLKSSAIGVAEVLVFA